jgi:cobaltochelatase CobS
MNATVKEMKAGDTIKTKWGRAVIQSVGTKASRSGKRTFHAYTIRFEATGKTVTVTRRGLGKMQAERVEPTAAATVTVTEQASGKSVTQSLGEWQAARDRLKEPVETVEPEPVEAVEPEPGPTGDLARMLAAMVKPHINAKVSRDEVVALVKEQVSAMAVQRTEVVRLDGSVQNVGVQHFRFEGLLRLASCRLHTYLVGPAGSGKTTAAKNVADAFGLPFYTKSVGQQTTEISLLGFKNGMSGEYVLTDLRRAYEEGGVFLLDEIDSGNASVLVVLNSLLANGFCAFPDKLVYQHKDFIMLAGANTIGQGGDRQYVGKFQLDATTLDRFVFCDWQYDPHIEAAKCGVPVDCFGTRPAGFTLHDPNHTAAQAMCEAYCRKANKVRESVASFGGGVRHLVGSRSLYSGVTMIRAGFTAEDAEEMCIWKGVDSATRSKIESRC